MMPIERELTIARDDGVRNENNLPFLLEPEQPSNRGILLIHGFSATPWEMRPLGEMLFRRGDTVFAVRLPGHGTSPSDLAGRSAEEWLAAVERGYQLLAERNLSIVGIGQSTGSLLLLRLSLSRSFDAMVLLSPFLRLKHPLAPFAGLLHYWMPYNTRPLPESEQPYYYQKRPLKGIKQINRLRRQIKAVLHKISQPVLTLAAQGDETIAPGTSLDLFQRLGSTQKKFHSFGPEVPHVLTTSGNPRQQEVFTQIDEFLSSISPENQQS